MFIDDFIIAVFCLVDDLSKKALVRRERGPAPLLSDAEVLTIDLVGDFLRLGDGSNKDHIDALDVTGLGTGVVEVSARAFHACAVTYVGSVKCWGGER